MRFTDAEEARLAAMYQADSKMKQLALMFGIRRNTVAVVLDRRGVIPRQHGLAADDVERAAMLYADGWSLAKVGEEFGCTADDPPSVQEGWR